MNNLDPKIRAFNHLPDLPDNDYPHTNVVNSRDHHKRPADAANRLNYTSFAIGVLVALAFLAWAFRTAWLVGCAQ
jgi:hypothetical protein